MDPTEVLIRKVNRQRKLEIIQFLAKRIGQTRESAKLHPHGQILPFHKTSGDVPKTRIADSHLGYNLDDWSWGVTLIPVLAVIAVQLHKLREVHVQPECVCNSILIEGESIRSQLDLIRQTLLQIKYEAARAGHRSPWVEGWSQDNLASDGQSASSASGLVPITGFEEIWAVSAFAAATLPPCRLLARNYFLLARYLGTITQVPGMSTSGFGDLSSKNLFRVSDKKDNPRLVRGGLAN